MKKIEKLKAIFLIGILTFSLLPIRISADTYNDHIRGYTMSYQSNIITWTFDEHVIGYFEPTIKFKIVPNGVENTIRPTIRVNGTQVSYVIYNDYLYDVSFTIFTSSFRVVADMDLTSVIQYLSEIYDNQNDLIDQLELIYGNSDTLTKMRHWNFPIESFTAIYPFMLEYSPKDMTTYNSYTYPLFEVKNGDVMFNSMYTSSSSYDTTLIFGIDYLLYDGNIENYIIPTTNDYTRSAPQTISRVLISDSPTIWYQIVRVDYHYTGSGTVSFGIQFKRDFKILPIYWNLKRNEYLSTDFALQYGLSNKLLDDLHIIASGTNQSQNSSSAADQENVSFSDQASDLYDQENDFISDFQDSLGDVSPDFNMGQGFGSLFMTSATWVRDQFDNIVDNTPFASLLTFSLTLGIGLLIIGKVIHK